MPAPGGPDESSFADLELPPPKPSSNLIKPKERTVQGVGMRKPEEEEASFGSLGLDDERMDSDLPPSLRVSLPPASDLTGRGYVPRGPVTRTRPSACAHKSRSSGERFR